MTVKGALGVCPNGHKYYKSSDCPTCSVSENNRKTNNILLDSLSAPARRAFESEGITTTKKLAQYSEQDILKLHGVGSSSLPRLKKLLMAEKRNFKKS